MMVLYKSQHDIVHVFFLVLMITFSSSACARNALGLSNKQIQQLLNSPGKKTRATPHKRKNARTRGKIIKISKATDKAKQMLRVPYRWGGTSPKGFDCSGLVQYAYKRVGVALPRTAAEQYKATRRIKHKYTARGDLIFFHTRRSRKYVNHVGIYLGNGRFIHAPGRGKRVRISTLSNYWRKKMVGVGRAI